MTDEPFEKPPILDYAPPRLAEPAITPRVIVDGDTIISTIPMRLPKRCVKCNGLDTVRMTQTFSLPAGMGLRVGVTGHFSLCRRHYRQRVVFLVGCTACVIALFASGVVLFALVAKHLLPQEMLIFIILFWIVCPALVMKYAKRRSRLLTIKYIDERGMWMNGAGQPFLESLRQEARASTSVRIGQ